MLFGAGRTRHPPAHDGGPLVASDLGIFIHCSPLTIILHLRYSEICGSLLEMHVFSRWYRSKLYPSVLPPLPSFGKDLKKKP